MQPPFDPSNPFGDAPEPVSPLGSEIEELAAQFAANGMNAHHTVNLWLGKPNRFTSTIMRSAQEVLDYVTAELEDQARARAAVAATPAAGATGDADAVVTATGADQARAALQARRAAHKVLEQEAGDAWRKAIRGREAAMLDWNKYVEHLRVQFNLLKMNRPK